MSNNELSLAESFQQYFSVDMAQTPSELEQVYQLRYRVYCEELRYEPKELFPDQAECDDYESQSLHLLITHRKTGLPAACVRLVKSLQSGYQLLPFERNFPHSLDPNFFSRFNLDRSSICEISRLAVDRRFRRRVGEVYGQVGDFQAMEVDRKEQRAFSLLSEVAFLAATALTVLSGRSNVFALMEPYLCRLLGRSGIYFMRVGGDIQHNGMRAPYFITSEYAVNSMRLELLELYQMTYDKLSSTYSSIEAAA